MDINRYSIFNVEHCLKIHFSVFNIEHCMDGLAILSRPHAFRFLVELNGGPMKESELGKLSGNYYTAHNMLLALEGAGLVERFEMERSSANWYRLTAKGGEVAVLLQRAVEVVEGC